MANQPFFKYIKRKITPAEIQKIMQKKDWFAPPALLAGGAASLIFFENGSRIVQYLLPNCFSTNVIEHFKNSTSVGVFVYYIASNLSLYPPL